MRSKPLKIITVSIVLSFLGMLLVSKIFSKLNAPILRNIAATQQRMDELARQSDEMHRAWAAKTGDFRFSASPLSSDHEHTYYKGVNWGPTAREIRLIAQAIWGEARGCSAAEQALVAWTIFQRTDDPRWPGSIAEVVTQPHQFAYAKSFPVDENIHNLVLKELQKWQHGAAPPTLSPYAATARYYFFEGDGAHNWFRER
jgi:spore germination cell wall hydrolase CwlJ-like protein